jgi:hypothetical protein
MRRLYSQRAAAAFAVIWIGALSVYWIHIKMNVHFQSVVKLGVDWPFPLSFAYVSAIYFFAITLIIWAGIGISVGFAGQLSSHHLLKGLFTASALVALSLLTQFFLSGMQLSPILKYTTTWVPLFLALYVGIRVALGKSNTRVRP